MGKFGAFVWPMSINSDCLRKSLFFLLYVYGFWNFGLVNLNECGKKVVIGDGNRAH